MTQTQIEDIFWRATVICLGLNPDSQLESVQTRVRISWPTSEAGNSDWGREENVVFLRISPGLDDYGRLLDISHEYDAEHEQLHEVVRYHRTYQINWICYGPGSNDDADTIRIGILRDAIRTYLFEHKVAVFPGITEPVRMPEQDESGEWWERCDLTAQCYEYCTREYTEQHIGVAPNITISDD